MDIALVLFWSDDNIFYKDGDFVVYWLNEILLNVHVHPGVAMHTCNPSTQKAEAGGLPRSLDYVWAQVQHDWHNDIPILQTHKQINVRYKRWW